MLPCDSNAVAGFCVSPQNVDGLKNAIEKILDDKNLSEKLAQNARSRVLSEYKIEVIWNQLVTIWENALN